MALNKLEAFLEDTVIAQVADVAAAKGISFDEALEEMIGFAAGSINNRPADFGITPAPADTTPAAADTAPAIDPV